MSIVKSLDEMWSRASFILGPDKLRAILPALEFNGFVKCGTVRLNSVEASRVYL